MLGVTLIFLSLLNVIPRNYFVVYDQNRAFIVRSDSAVFWVRVGKAMKIVSEPPSNTPKAKLFDPPNESWLCDNHNFWVAMLSAEGITVGEGEKITVNKFENLLKTKAKNKEKYKPLDKTTKMILTLFSTNFSGKKNEIPYQDGKIVIVNYNKLDAKSPYYIAAKSFMVLSDSKVKPKAIKNSLRKAFSDPDFATLMAEGGAAGGVAPVGTGGEADTTLLKALRVNLGPDVSYIVVKANQPVTIDSIDITGYEQHFTVLDKLPKKVTGTDSISLAFASEDDIQSIMESGVIGGTFIVNGKPVEFFVQVTPPGGATVGGGEEGLVPPAGGEVQPTTEAPSPPTTEEPEVITIDEGTGGAAQGGGISKSLLILLIVGILAILIFLYLTYRKVGRLASRLTEFDTLVDDLRGSISALEGKIQEQPQAPPVNEKLETTLQQILGIVQGLQFQIEGVGNTMQEVGQEIAGNVKRAVKEELQSQAAVVARLEKKIERLLDTISSGTTVKAETPSAPMTPEPEYQPPATEEISGAPHEPSEMFEEFGGAGGAGFEPPSEPTVMEIKPPETEPEGITIEEREIPSRPEVTETRPRKAESGIRALLAEIAQKLKKLQDNRTLKVSVLIRDMINSIPEPSKKLALQHTYQKFLDIAEGWDRIKNQVRVLREVASGQIPETAEVRMEFEALEASIEDLSAALEDVEKSYNLKDYLPLIDAISSYPQMKPRLEELTKLLDLEQIEVPVGRPLTDEEAEQVEVWDVEGFGTRQVVIDVIANGYRSKTTGEIIRKPRVKVRLE